MTQSPCLPELPKLHRALNDFAHQCVFGNQNLRKKAADAVIALFNEAGSAAAAQAVPEGFWLAPDDLDQSMMVAANRQYRDNTTCTARDLFQAVRADWILRNGRFAAPTQGAEGAAPQAVVGKASERCETCGGRDIPWGYGKCHCFKIAKDDDGREQHGAGVEGAPQNGTTDAEASGGRAGLGANLGDQHRSAEAEDHGHAGYSLGEEVRLPSRRELQEGIDLTPEPEDLRAYRAALTPSPTALREALADCITRMDRARSILTDGRPTPDCNWGMLDASAARTALAQHQPQQGEQL